MLNSICNCCYFIPPQIGREIVKHGTEQQKETALNNLLISTRLRGLRDGLLEVDPERPTGELTRQIYTADNEELLPGYLVANEGDDNRPSKDIDSVYDLLGVLYRVMKDLTGLNSMDGAGIPLVATCHFGEDYNNAFWNGEQFAIGEGDGELFKSFAQDPTVIFHEGAHGYIAYIAPQLTYFGENGCLNEHWADVIAVVVEQTMLKQTVDKADFKIGRNVLTKNVNGSAVRSMKAPGTAYDDPVLGKDKQPAHMRDLYTGNRDNGGVHINSGIPNKFFYEVAIRIGGNISDKTARIWFQAMQELDQNTDLKAFYNLIKKNAIALFGKNSPEVNAVVAGGEVVGFVQAKKTANPKSEPTTKTTAKPKREPEPAKTRVLIEPVQNQNESKSRDHAKSDSVAPKEIAQAQDCKPKTKTTKTKKGTGKKTSSSSGAKANQKAPKTAPKKEGKASRSELRASDLAKRLGVKTSVVTKHKNEPDWFALRDPKKIRWHFDDSKKVFYSDKLVSI